MGGYGSSDGVLLVVGYSTRTRGVAKAALSGGRGAAGWDGEVCLDALLREDVAHFVFTSGVSGLVIHADYMNFAPSFNVHKKRRSSDQGT
ncbi:hypothetical protein INR49_000011 [Caranx melampygus]|nr:hypothetical protein INR49_000055 [Caranx melampygus]KAG7236927.1 hypothetical protein INR49_000011 [Caranx melampygus]